MQRFPLYYVAYHEYEPKKVPRKGKLTFIPKIYTYSKDKCISCLRSGDISKYVTVLQSRLDDLCALPL